MERKRLLVKLVRIVFGLTVLSFGIHLTIGTDIGVSPWDMLAIGISLHLPMSYGMAMTLTSLLILIADLVMREKIGVGTLLDAVLTGNMTDLFLHLNLLPASMGIVTRLILFLLGLFLVALGQYFYMSSGQGCGPRDSFLIAVGKRMPKIPIGTVDVIIFVVVFLLGWLTGGPIGIGTVLFVLLLGPMIQLVCRIFRFEPRAVVHQDILSAVRQLVKG